MSQFLARLPGLLPLTLLLYVAAAFTLPKGEGSALVFYFCIVPCLLAAIAVPPRPQWPALVGDTPTALAMALIIWSGLTLLWGEDDKHRSWQFAADSLATFGFVLAMVVSFSDPVVRDRLARVLVVAGGANASFAIARAVLVHTGQGPRLHGWGLTSHPILGALVMLTAYLTALARGLDGQHRSWPYLAAAAVMALFVAMTESRGPLLAGGISTVFLCAAGPWRWRALGSLAALAAAYVALPAAVHQRGADVIVRRGASHRVEIWDYALHLIGNRPLFGHGLAANMHLAIDDKFDPDITFPHDLYLSLLFYGGGVALLLFVTLVGVLAWRLYQGWDEREAPWLAALGLCALVGGLTDLGQITKGPGTMWLILWLPVGLIIGRSRTPQAATTVA